MHSALQGHRFIGTTALLGRIFQVPIQRYLTNAILHRLIGTIFSLLGRTVKVPGHTFFSIQTDS